MIVYQTAGSSLRVWRDVFPNAQIFGWDVDPKTMLAEEDDDEEARIKTFTIDSSNKTAVDEFFHRELGWTWEQYQNSRWGSRSTNEEPSSEEPSEKL